MGVIQRFKDIMSANINAMLDKAENPEKMIDQYMRNLENDLGKCLVISSLCTCFFSHY